MKKSQVFQNGELVVTRQEYERVGETVAVADVGSQAELLPRIHSNHSHNIVIVIVIHNTICPGFYMKIMIINMLCHRLNSFFQEYTPTIHTTISTDMIKIMMMVMIMMLVMRFHLLQQELS